MRFILLLIAILALSAPAYAKKSKAVRTPTAASIPFSREAPARVNNEDAVNAFSVLTRQIGAGNNFELDHKNLSEAEALTNSLKSRGYVPLTAPLRGNVSSSARSLTYYAEGSSTPNAIEFRFYYTQVFVEKDVTLSPSTLVPNLVQSGIVFVECDKSPFCRLTSVTFDRTSIEWDYLPSGRGAESSSGGVVKEND